MPFLLAYLYGSCTLGTDTSESDFNLFVVPNRKKEASNIISDFKFPKGYENIHIQSVIKPPVELLKGGAPGRLTTVKCKPIILDIVIFFY
jgi:hypothetical protein